MRFRTEIGYLYAGVSNRPERKYKHKNEYCTLQVDDEIRKHDKSIIRCKFVDDKFIFVCNRSGHNHPNSLISIKGNISKMNKYEIYLIIESSIMLCTLSKTGEEGKSCVQGTPHIFP